jgi:hypothetical protein
MTYGSEHMKINLTSMVTVVTEKISHKQNNNEIILMPKPSYIYLLVEKMDKTCIR